MYNNIIKFIISIILILLSFYFLLPNNKETFVNQDKIKKLKLKCGLPDNYQATSHCFADNTHHTCCLLGPEARKYADSSGNPIGSASDKANNEFLKQNPDSKQSDLKPWCTCHGSKVCSYYSKKFNDGTHIKFINNPNNDTEIVSNVSPNCEGYYRDKFDIQQHDTPGIQQNQDNCDQYGTIETV